MTPGANDEFRMASVEEMSTPELLNC